MRLLITQPHAGIFEGMQGELAAKALPIHMSWPCLPCVGHGLAAFCCALDRDCVCVKYPGYEMISRMPCVPGPSALCLSHCGRYVYQLSSEADCIHTRLIATGELLYAAPAGVFPRTMQMDETGRHLLVAGGAVAQAYVFSAPELVCERTIHTRHPCFGAGFWQEGFVLVCAAEGNDIRTAVYTLRKKAVKPRRLIELSGPPGDMCVCPDGRHMLLSTPDGLMKIHLGTGEILWNRPEWPMCMHLVCRDDQALVSDTLDAKAYLINHHRPWECCVVGNGAGVQACFLA